MPFTIKAVLPVLPKPDHLVVENCVSKSMNCIEDKELRKKLRNRQSALAARERKKARMLELERKVDELQQSNNELIDENSKLKRTLSALLYSPTSQNSRDSMVQSRLNQIQNTAPANNAVLRLCGSSSQLGESRKYVNYNFVTDKNTVFQPEQFANKAISPIDYSMQNKRNNSSYQQHVVQGRVIKIEHNPTNCTGPMINTQYSAVNGLQNDVMYDTNQEEMRAKRLRLCSSGQNNVESKEHIRSRLHSSPSTITTGYHSNPKQSLPPIDAVLQSPPKTANILHTTSTAQNESNRSMDYGSLVKKQLTETNSNDETSQNCSFTTNNNSLSAVESPNSMDNSSAAVSTLQRDPYLHLANELFSYQDENTFSKSFVGNSNLDSVTGNYTANNADDNALYMKLNENLTGYSPLDSISSCDSGVGIDDDSLEWIPKVPMF